MIVEKKLLNINEATHFCDKNEKKKLFILFENHMYISCKRLNSMGQKYGYKYFKVYKGL